MKLCAKGIFHICVSFWRNFFGGVFEKTFSKATKAARPHGSIKVRSMKKARLLRKKVLFTRHPSLGTEIKTRPNCGTTWNNLPQGCSSSS